MGKWWAKSHRGANRPLSRGFDLGTQDRVKVWDSKLTGFGVTIGKLRTSFMVQRRIGSEQRVITVGRWGAQKMRALQPQLLTVARARDAAVRVLADMMRGEDPVTMPRRSATPSTCTSRG